MEMRFKKTVTCLALALFMVFTLLPHAVFAAENEDSGIVIIQQPADTSAFLGDKVTVSVEAAGYPLKYQWYYRDAGSKTFTRSSIQESTYVLTMTEARDNREVYCVITDAYGNQVVSDTVELCIKEPTDVETVYYASLHDALNGRNGTTNQTTASIAVISAADEICILLLQDVELDETLTVNADITVDLNGHKIMSDINTAIKINSNTVIEGTVSGSGMTAVAPYGEKAVLLEVESGKLVINGGNYDVTTTNGGSGSSQAAAIIVGTGASLQINNAAVTASDTENGSVVGILGREGSVLDARDTTVTVSSGESMENVAVYTKGDAVMANCTLIAEADYTANAAGTNYASNSRGIYIEGNLELYDCYVWGAHAGVTAKGSVYVDGGTYEGYGHGAFYLAGSGTTSYFYNAVLNWAAMREGTYADSVAGTNGAGFYIGGGASNITVYMDNCDIFGTLYGVVLRRSGGEQNNAVYISNSVVEGSRYAFRTQTAKSNLKVYNGMENVFKAPNIVDYSACLEETGESYAKK